MINLRDYMDYWVSAKERSGVIDRVLPVTIDDQMGKRIQQLPSGELTLFVFPPVSESTARTADAYTERNRCVLFVMRKYDPQRSTSFEVLTETQPTTEILKKMLVDDAAAGCHRFRLDVGSIETAPETELYGRFAGWSIAFTATSF